MTSTSPQRYSSTRGGSASLSFENAILQGLAADGGLFLPESIPSLPAEWHSWQNLNFADLAFEIMSLYISRSEIDTGDLRKITQKSYSVFRNTEVTPLITLDRSKDLYLLELFHGPTFAFKDVALQFLGSLFEFFLVRKNSKLDKNEKRHHLTIIGATSGDTGSAAIYGLRNKKDVSVFIMFPEGRVSPVQEAQMTTVLDANVHCLAVDGTFDDCQDIVKALFADEEIKKTQHLAAVNSINWARILAQITYYFHAYFSLLRQFDATDADEIRFAVPTGNFGDVLAGYFAKKMGLPVSKLIVSTNENDILHRFWKTGRYEKQFFQEGSNGIPADGAQAHPEGVRETLSPAMDILVSSNFERLLWILVYEDFIGQSIGSPDLLTNARTTEAQGKASQKIRDWYNDLKKSGDFDVGPEILHAARQDFQSERVSDKETIATIKSIYKSSQDAYVLDPHSAIGVAASLRSLGSSSPRKKTPTISLATAHPAKFANAVNLALEDEAGYSFDAVLPKEFVGLENKERRVRVVSKGQGLDRIREVILDEVGKEGMEVQ